MCGLLLVSCSSLPSVQKGQSLADYLDAIGFSGSVLVSLDGKVIHSAGYGFADREQQILNAPDTQFYIASLTKQFTALAIMQLQEQGLLNVEDPVTKYLPDFHNGSEITIKHLLTHSAGLYDFTDEWNKIKESNVSTLELVDMFKDKPLEFEPGSKVKYSSSGYILAGLIIEKVSGMSYADYIESQIFKPLNMEHSAYGQVSASNLVKAVGYKNNTPQKSINMSIPYAAGSLVSSVTDFYLWDQSFYNLSLVSKSSLQEIYPDDRNLLGIGFGEGKFKVVMGLGWGVYETQFGPEYSHTGNVDGYSTVVSRYPNQKAMIVVLSNQDRFDVFSLKNKIASLLL